MLGSARLSFVKSFATSCYPQSHSQTSKWGFAFRSLPWACLSFLMTLGPEWAGVIVPNLETDSLSQGQSLGLELGGCSSSATRCTPCLEHAHLSPARLMTGNLLLLAAFLLPLHLPLAFLSADPRLSAGRA